MDCKHFLYLSWLWYLAKYIYAEQTVFRLSPMPYSFYYFSEARANYQEAHENCDYYNQELVSIFDSSIYEQVHTALLAHPLWHQFVGPAHGLYSSAITSTPWDKNNFAWYSGSQKYLIINTNISSIIWAPEQPDNLAGNETCTVIYLFSLKNPKLVLEDVECSQKHGFLCHRPQFLSRSCSDMKHLTSLELTVGLTEADWSRAFECCNELGLTLPVLQTEELRRNFSDRIWNSGIPELPFELDISKIWTYASKVWDVFNKDEFYQPYLRNYRWSDHSWYRLNRHARQHCLAFSESGNGTLEPFHCYKKLAYICVEQQKPLPCANITFDVIKTVKAADTLYYSNHTIMPWEDALECCASRKQRLISIVSADVGNSLASYFHSDKRTAMRHEGLSYGIWTAAKLQKDGSFEFATVYTRIRYTQSGDSNFILGPSGGDCLQYVVSGPNSYVLNNISCTLSRSFICEDIGESPVKRNIKEGSASWKELGHKYTYSTVLATWKEAFDSCTALLLDLLTITNEEENNVILRLIQGFSKHNTPSTGIWLGATAVLNGQTLKNFMWATTNSTIEYSNFIDGQLRRKYRHENCLDGFAVPSGFFWDNIDCNQRLNYICQKKDDPPVPCSDVKIEPLTDNFFISSVKMRWTVATKCAADLGYVFVFITSEEKNKAVYEALQKVLNASDTEKDSNKKSMATAIEEGGGVWLGGSNVHYGDTLMWDAIGEPLNYTNFLGKFTKVTVEQAFQCINAFIKDDEGLVWTTENCDKKRHFLLEKQEPLPDCSKMQPIQLKKSKFFYVEQKVPWGHHVHCAKVLNMAPASITNNKENKLVYSLLVEVLKKTGSENAVWIGLSDTDIDGRYTWIISGDEIKGSSWKEDPSKKKTRERCVLLYADEKDKKAYWVDANCGKRLSFLLIYEAPLKENAVTPIGAPMKSGKFTLYHIGATYFISKEKTTWQEAFHACPKSGTTLLSLPSEEINDRVSKLVSEKLTTLNPTIWTSGTDVHNEGSFWWLGIGKSFTYRNWNKRKDAKKLKDGRDCVSICNGTSEYNSNPFNLVWTEETCDIPHFFICEIQSTCKSQNPMHFTPPLKDGHIHKTDDGLLHFFSNISLDWSAAALYCRRFSMELASVQTEQENKALATIGKGKQYWTSGTDLGREGSRLFYWAALATSLKGYKGWARGKPENKAHKKPSCIMINKKGEWEDDDCSKLNLFICENIDGCF